MAEQQLSITARRILRQARQVSADLGHSYVGTEHLLLALLRENQCPGVDLLLRAGITADRAEECAAQLIGTGTPGAPPCQGLTAECGQCIRFAAQESTPASRVEGEHLLLGLLRTPNTAAESILRRCGGDRERLYRQVRASLGGGSSLPFHSRPREGESLREGRGLEQYTRDLTRSAAQGRLDPVTGRDAELKRTIEILCRRSKNNPVILGDPGVGKTALVEALAQAIASGQVPDPLRHVQLLSLDLSAVIAGTKYRGEFEERLRKLLREVRRRGNVILFLDEMHTLIGAGSAEGAIDAANLLKPALGRGEIQLIGATTQEEYRKHICRDAALARRFQPVNLEPPTESESIAILRTLRPRYEGFHRVLLSDEAVEAAVRLSQRYLPDRFLPDKAIDLMDQTAARVRIRHATEPPELAALEERMGRARQELQQALDSHDYEEAARVQSALDSFRTQTEALRLDWDRSRPDRPPTVTPADIGEVLADWTGIPCAAITAAEAETLLELEQTLHRTIVGQEAAVSAVAHAIRRSRSGLGDPDRPVGAFLFAGPSGVGKTALCRALAQSLYGRADALLRLDLSEYSEASSVARLTGSPPGYVGHEEGGQLTERVRRRPYSVVLFDEVEKANPLVWNLLLQILEDGALTDAQGRKADFRHAVVILTTNLGAECFGAQPLGFGGGGAEDRRQAVLTRLRKTFRPELLNRLDEILCFPPLTAPEVRRVAEGMLSGLRDQLARRSIGLTLSPAALDWLAGHGSSPEYGVRPLRRLIRDELENPCADALLSGALTGGDTLRVEAREDGLRLEFDRPHTLAAMAVEEGEV